MTAKIIEQSREMSRDAKHSLRLRETVALHLFGTIRSLEGSALRKNGADRVVITPQPKMQTRAVEEDARRLGWLEATVAEMPQVTGKQVEESQQIRFRGAVCGAVPSRPMAITGAAGFGTPDALQVGVLPPVFWGGIEELRSQPMRK